MGSFRFRRSVKILPGVRINFNLKSTSITFGGRGYKQTISTTGRKTKTVGIPGTGISYTETSKPSQEVKNDTERILGDFSLIGSLLLGSIGIILFSVVIAAIVMG